jgi:diguanylate cyclase (GGDEF)-like protein
MNSERESLFGIDLPLPDLPEERAPLLLTLGVGATASILVLRSNISILRLDLLTATFVSLTACAVLVSSDTTTLHRNSEARAARMLMVLAMVGLSVGLLFGLGRLTIGDVRAPAAILFLPPLFLAFAAVIVRQRMTIVASFASLLLGSALALGIIADVSVQQAEGSLPYRSELAIAGLLMAVATGLSIIGAWQCLNFGVPGSTGHWRRITVPTACLAYGALGILVSDGNHETFLPFSHLALVSGTLAVLVSRTSQLNIAGYRRTRSFNRTSKRDEVAKPLTMVASLVVVALGASASVWFWRVSADSRHLAIAVISSYTALITVIGIGSFTAVDAMERLRITSLLARRERESLTDSLTGLPNRRAADERLRQECQRSQRYERNLAIALLDLDDFKSVNDRFGHQAGDQLLKIAADAIASAVRSVDLASRYGGEEFLVILPETTTEGAAVVVNRIRASIAGDSRSLSGVNRPITASAGIASLPQHGLNPEDLISSADTALYAAKHGGKNRVVVAKNNPRLETGLTRTR